MATTKLGLPTVTSNMSADVPRDLNALAEAVDAKMGVAGGLATLDSGGKVPSGQLPAMDYVPNTHVADYRAHLLYNATTGAANAYVLTPAIPITSYADIEGVAVGVKINVNNTGASTINISGKGAKTILNSKGNPLPAGTLKSEAVYTLKYNGTSFFLQGEGASGDALASDLLSGKTASTDAGEITGAMPNNGALTITPGSTNKPIPLGYHNGNGVISGDTNLNSSNILAGKTIFGIPGNVIAGKRYATGTANLNSYRVIQVRGLSFRPRIVLAVYYYESAGGTKYIYMHDFETYGNFIGMEATVIDTNGNFNGYGPILKSSGNLSNGFSNDGFDVYIGTSTTGVRWYAWE